MHKDHRFFALASFIAACLGFVLTACGGLSRYPKEDPPTDAATTADATPLCNCVCNCNCRGDATTTADVVMLNNDTIFASDPVPGSDSPTNRDLPTLDAIPDNIIAAKTDLAPDLSPDLTPTPDLKPPPDLTPPPDLRPCTTATCLCPAASMCKPTALMTVPSISDYSSLPYSSFRKSESGFGVYTQDPPTSTLCTEDVKATVGAAPSDETNISYTFTVPTEYISTGVNAIYAT